MNKKEEKVLRLWKEGTDMRIIARRCGFEGSSMTKGIEWIKSVLSAHGIKV
jgi:hypothetical protein